MFITLIIQITVQTISMIGIEDIMAGVANNHVNHMNHTNHSSDSHSNHSSDNGDNQMIMKGIAMKLKIIIEPDEDVWTAYCPQLPGCVSYGKTKEDALLNIREAIELYLRPAPGVFDKLPGDAEIMEIAV